MRLPILPPSNLNDQQREVYHHIVRGPRSSGPFNALLYAPTAGEALQALGAAVRYGTSLTDRAALGLPALGRWDVGAVLYLETWGAGSGPQADGAGPGRYRHRLDRDRGAGHRRPGRSGTTELTQQRPAEARADGHERPGPGRSLPGPTDKRSGAPRSVTSAMSNPCSIAQMSVSMISRSVDWRRSARSSTVVT